MSWVYGVTTVPERRDELLPRTLTSLATAGFPSPRLFIDGEANPSHWSSFYQLEVTTRFPRIRTFGNWILALAELYARYPAANRYALFQDDIVCGKNMRQYLDTIPFLDNAYWNLITYPQNTQIAPRDLKVGFYPSNQMGLGAQGLVFGRAGVLALLGSKYTLERPQDAHRGWRAIDGGIVTAMKAAGFRELVHKPSLLYHTGTYSTMGNRMQPEIPAFVGEDFDCMTLIEEAKSNG